MKEVELFDYLKIIWKKKWIVIIGTVSSVILALIVSFFLKPVYEIDAIIQPGKILVETQSGSISVFVVEDTKQIADKIRTKSYNALVASELKMNETEIPILQAENIKDTLLVRIWTRCRNKERGRKILDTLVLLIKKEIDEKVGIEISKIDHLIKTDEIDKEGREKEIEILKKKLKIIDQRKKDIVNEMESMGNRIRELEKRQTEVLDRKEKNETEALGLLLYSNVVQQNLLSYDLLNEKLKREKIEEETIHSQIQSITTEISKLDNDIANLKEKKEWLDFTQIVKRATSTQNPVFPQKRLNIILGFILGLIFFTFIAFFIDYIESRKMA